MTRRWLHIRTPLSAEFTELASDQRIAKAAAALERNGIRPLLAATAADARGLVGSLLVDGAEVYNNTSQTLEAIGVADDIERSGRYQPLRLRLYRMDREMQRRELRILAASPDHVVGSVHALTEGGSLLIASASGSQLGPLVSGAGQVTFVIGAQKIVGDVAAAGSATVSSSAGPTSPPPAAGIDAGEIGPNVDRDDASRAGDSNQLRRRRSRARCKHRAHGSPVPAAVTNNFICGAIRSGLASFLWTNGGYTAAAVAGATLSGFALTVSGPSAAKVRSTSCPPCGTLTARRLISFGSKWRRTTPLPFAVTHSH